MHGAAKEMSKKPASEGTVSNSETQSTTPENDIFQNVPKEYIKESITFQRYCYKEYKLNRYYNCDCLAANFLDQRIKEGPDALRDAIMKNIESTCQDTTEAVGMAYKDCMSNSMVLPMNMDPEAYCNCYASNFGKIFEESNLTPTAPNLTKAQTKAHVYCRKPGIAETLYRNAQ